MNDKQVATNVYRVIREVFGQPDLSLVATTTAKDVHGWDSFKQVEILLSLEALYGITFSTDDLDSMRTVGDIITAVQRHAAP